MKKKATKPRIHIELTAVWGNDDADSTIKVSRRRWKQIQEGAEYETTSWAWYEGGRFSVSWRFSGGKLTICDHITDLPVEELIVQTSE